MVSRPWRLPKRSPTLMLFCLILRCQVSVGIWCWTNSGGDLRDCPLSFSPRRKIRRRSERSLSSGALGYVPKSASSATLIGALKLVLQGDVYVPPLMLNERPRAVPTTPPVESLPRLTQRQSDVLRLVQRGISNKLIARELGLSEKTVKVHVTSILKALNVTNRTAAISAVQELLKPREK